MNARIYISVFKQRPELVSPRFGLFPKDIARRISWDGPGRDLKLGENPLKGGSTAEKLQDALLGEQIDYAFRISGREQLDPAGSVPLLSHDVGIEYAAKSIAEDIKRYGVEQYGFIDPLEDLRAMIVWSRTSLFRDPQSQEMIRDQIQLYGRDALDLLYRRLLNDEEKSVLESKVAELVKS